MSSMPDPSVISANAASKQFSKLPFETVKRTVITRAQDVTDPAFGKSPEQQTMQERLQAGFVVINKPRGPTSHQISEYTKHILEAESTGHSGTLDPNVTGVLAIGVNKSTRIIQALLNAGKEYVCLMHVHAELSDEKIRNTCTKFVGDIMQLPPVKSAVKRQLRKRTIYYLDVIEVDGKDVLFRVGCQAGTYIRKLCSDIGEKLGCGAHMQQLIRTKAGGFSDKQMISLGELADAYADWKEKGDDSKLRSFVLPQNAAVSHLPHVWIADGAINPICHGAPLAVPGVCQLHSGIKPGDMIALISLKGELVCLAKAEMSTEQMLAEKNGIAATLVRVVMDENLYPRHPKREKKDAATSATAGNAGTVTPASAAKPQSETSAPSHAKAGNGTAPNAPSASKPFSQSRHFKRNGSRPA